MTHLDIILTGPARTWRHLPELYGIQTDLQSFILERLNFDLKNDPCDLHLALIERAVQEKATILSLNYDLVLDHALKKSAKGDAPFDIFWKRSLSLVLDDRINYSLLPYESIEGGRFIKLHGALNWWRCTNDRCRNREQLLIHPFGNVDEELTPESKCRQCGYGLEIAIVPPTMKGVFERFSRLGFLWATALNDLREATSITVIGVSFTASDYVLRWLIRESIFRKNPLQELVIVNPDVEAASVARSLLHAKTNVRFRSFDNFLKNENREAIPTN